MSKASTQSALLDAELTSGGFHRGPKRVILRLRVNEFDGCDSTEFDMLDIEKNMLRDLDLGEVQHEVHRVRRDMDDTLYAITSLYSVNFGNLTKMSKNSTVERIRNPVEEQNFVRKMRHFIDIFYPWAK
ncbi:hypothetical protein GX50_04508 [[Emmonsia] crescens]|uniref:Uncharacterized protein n=1 Tax=[Emmonsia] crescens TaxID=73230 RepID=A0A2B7ZH10_9EURO|nr:hypothetical protein GX50_04508 [Emmonsia crescens]